PVQITNDGSAKSGVLIAREHSLFFVAQHEGRWGIEKINTSRSSSALVIPYNAPSLGLEDASADGSELLVVKADPIGGRDLSWVVSAEHGRSRMVISGCERTAWAPDFQSFACVSAGAVNHVGSDGRWIRRIGTLPPGNSAAFHWSPRGDRLRFVLEGSGGQN